MTYIHPLDENDPSCQIIIEDKLSCLTDVIRIKTAFKNKDITIPINIIVLLDILLSSFLHKLITNIIVKTEKINPITG